MSLFQSFLLFLAIVATFYELLMVAEYHALISIQGSVHIGRDFFLATLVAAVAQTISVYCITNGI